MKLIASIIFSILFFLFINLFQPLGYMIDIFLELPSLLFILIPSIFFLWVTKSHQIIIKYTIKSFKKNATLTATELQQLAAALGRLMKMIQATGATGFFFGLIGLLVNLEDPNHIGPSMAISLTCVFYTLLISFFILYPTKAWAQQQLDQKNSIQLQMQPI